MTPEQIQLVQSSFAQISPIRASIGALFYRRLFELDPALRWMFTTDIRQQSQKLMAMLDLIVGNLSQLETLRPTLQALGRAHADYGVTDEHYAVVRIALLWTLRAGLEEGFSAPAEAAWSDAYALIVDIMQAAAHSLNDRA
jgi:hemoglobin-like flavoprotein